MDLSQFKPCGVGDQSMSHDFNPDKFYIWPKRSFPINPFNCSYIQQAKSYLGIRISTE